MIRCCFVPGWRWLDSAKPAMTAPAETIPPYHRGMTGILAHDCSNRKLKRLYVERERLAPVPYGINERA
jgi:hypothetical protein